MKSILALALFLFAQAAFADGACKALSNFEGTYKLVTKSCETSAYGEDLTVKPYTRDWAPVFNGYWIHSGSLAMGPTTSDEVHDLDKCTGDTADILVEICGNDTENTCLPKSGWSYHFSGKTVLFMANGCSATYQKN
jgi:hypothetical protein